MTVELHSISLDKDTAITFKQSKFPLRYKSMRAMNDSEKSVLRDYIMQFYINLMKSKGYSLCLLGTSYTASELMNVATTLRIDGIPFNRWILE